MKGFACDSVEKVSLLKFDLSLKQIIFALFLEILRLKALDITLPGNDRLNNHEGRGIIFHV